MVAEAESLMKAETISGEVALFNIPGFHFYSTGLVIEDWVSFEDWVRGGPILTTAAKAVQWWIGDWLAHGEHKWGEKYSQATNLVKMEVQTLMNWAFVANSIQFSRRRENLSWSHHAEVAALPPKRQDEMLTEAEENALSKFKLRRRINAKKIEERDYADVEAPIARDYAKIKAAFEEARKGMDDFIAEYSQFADAWTDLAGEILWDLAAPNESAEDWVFRAVDKGAGKVQEIIDKTQLSRETIEAALYRLEKANRIKEEIQGAVTDGQRGARAKFYVAARQSNDDLYEQRRGAPTMPDWENG